MSSNSKVNAGKVLVSKVQAKRVVAKTDARLLYEIISENLVVNELFRFSFQ